MTDQQWQVAADVYPMLLAVESLATARHWRLLCCACCRLVWENLTDERSRGAVSAGEQYVDGRIDRFRMLQARDAAFTPSISNLAGRIAIIPAEPLFAGARGREYATDTVRALIDAQWQPASVLCDLVRHIFGSPFRENSMAAWPAEVVRLAEAVYQGSDALFALRDALLEAGLPEFAEHFQTEAPHPKGCWLVDAITGRQAHVNPP